MSRDRDPLARKISRRDALKLLGAGSAGLYLTGCVVPTAVPPSEGEPVAVEKKPAVSPEKDHIRIAWYEEVLTQDPTMTTMTPTFTVLRPLMFNGLVKQTAEAEIVPDLAVSWEILDPLTWEFKLREGVKFHNGEPFDAESVKFTFDQLTDPDRASIQAFLWAPVEGVEIIDAYTVHLKTIEPTGPMLRNLAIGCMLPPKAYDVETFATQPIGTGPFRFVEWVRGQKTVMEVNPDYWGDPPKANKVTYFPLGEEATRTAALRTGDVDIIFTVPVDMAATLMKEEGVQVTRILSCDTHVLSVGGKAYPSFKDHRLRQAVDYAVDRDKLINKLLNGYAQMPRSVISPMVFGFNPNLPPHPRDLDKAKALMAEAGMADGFEAEIQYTHNSLPKVADCVLSVAADLKEIGIDVRVRVHPDWPAAGSFMHPGKFDMFYNSWSTITLDADMPFWRNWHTGPAREIPEEGYDYSVELDALIEQGRYSLDEEERLEAYHKAQEFMWEYPTRMALYHSEDLWGVRDNVQGFEPTASRVLDLTQVYKI